MRNSPQQVSDVLSNLNDQLVNAAGIIGRSKQRQAVFKAIYRGQKQTKSVKELMALTGLTQIQVLKAGGSMSNYIIEHVGSAYKKKREFATRYKKILEYASNKKKLEKVPTKTSPKLPNGLKISFPKSAVRAKFITIDEIDSFNKIGIYSEKTFDTSEKRIKDGFKKIIGETGKFKDWGGERSDLFSTSLLYKGKRIRAAIAFKGKGTSGKLFPSKMGKNGDQINRLFTEPAELFFIVYPGEIDSSIISQMQAFAVGVALAGKRVFFGVIDKNDLGRLVSSYSKYFI